MVCNDHLAASLFFRWWVTVRTHPDRSNFYILNLTLMKTRVVKWITSILSDSHPLIINWYHRSSCYHRAIAWKVLRKSWFEHTIKNVTAQLYVLDLWGDDYTYKSKSPRRISCYPIGNFSKSLASKDMLAHSGKYIVPRQNGIKRRSEWIFYNWNQGYVRSSTRSARCGWDAKRLESVHSR